jgi:imidazolonepropionase-like amidohydrolase
MRAVAVVKAAGLLVGGLTAAFAAGVIWPTPSLPALRTEIPLAIVGVSIVDVRGGRIVGGQTVVVESGHIVAVGDAATTTPPPLSQVVDGHGRFLMPALWDMHAHVYAFSPLLDLPLHIAYGVTNVRDMQGCPQPGDPFIACAEDKRRWTQEALDGKRVAPRIVSTTSFMANGPRMLERIKGIPEHFGTATPEQARAFVRHFVGQADEIKVYDHIPRDAYFALADEAARLGLPVVGHRPHAVSAAEAAARQKSLEHARFVLHESHFGAGELRARAGTPQWREDRVRMLAEHDPQMAQEIFEALRRQGTWYVPTHLTRWADAYADDASVREDPLLRFLHPLMQWQWLEDIDATVTRDPSPEARAAYRAFYRKGLELTGAAHRAGVKVLAGTDYIVAGAALHRELEQLVEAGLAPADALRAATLSPAEYYGMQDRYGGVVTGATADLVLLSANPLDDIRNTQRIEAVLFAGNLYDRAALDRIVAHVESQARSWSAACKILWRFIRNPAEY